MNILLKISKDCLENISFQDYNGETTVLTGKKALIAEDVALNMEVAVELLKMIGIQAVCAEDGVIALDIFRRSKEYEFDVILLDINMPNMDGYETARRLRALDRQDIKTMPIFALTANVFAEDMVAAREAGMTGHISKPIELDVLYRTLKNGFNEGENHE